jgi:ribosome-binding factor A
MKERILRVNSLIRQELGKILLREVDFPGDALVTVTRVAASPSLNRARVYISTIPEQKSEEVMLILNRQVYFIQQKLNKKLNMRPMPKIVFFEEKETREAARVEELLEKIKNRDER